MNENKDINAISKVYGKSQQNMSNFLKLKSYYEEEFDFSSKENNLVKLDKILNYTPSLKIIQKKDKNSITVKFKKDERNPNHKINNLEKLANILNYTCSFEAVKRADKRVITVKKNDVFLYREFIQRTKNFQELSKGRKSSIYLFIKR